VDQHAHTHVHARTQQSPFAAIDVHCCCRPLRQSRRGLQSSPQAGSSVALNDLPRPSSAFLAGVRERPACLPCAYRTVLSAERRSGSNHARNHPRHLLSAAPRSHCDYEYQPSLRTQPSLSRRHPIITTATTTLLPPPRALQLVPGYCSHPTRSFVSARQ